MDASQFACHPCAEAIANLLISFNFSICAAGGTHKNLKIKIVQT